MANRLYQQMQQNNLSQNNGMMAKLKQIKQLSKMMKDGNNPNQMIEMMAQQNPQMASIMQEINSNGGNAKDLFMKKASQMGMDPNQIISMLK